MQGTDEMFLFQISDYDDPALDGETAELFRQRFEALSRNTVPFQWDEADEEPDNSAPKRLSQTVQWVIYGILVVALVMVALIPGLTESGMPTAILLVSVAAIFIFLAICLAREKKPLPISESCQKEAQEFLAKRRAINWAENTVKILFDGSGMTIFDEKRRETVPYREMKSLFETEDFCLLTYGDNQSLLIQRRDLVSGNALKFLFFLHGKIEENA